MDTTEFASSQGSAGSSQMSLVTSISSVGSQEETVPEVTASAATTTTRTTTGCHDESYRDLGKQKKGLLRLDSKRSRTVRLDTEGVKSRRRVVLPTAASTPVEKAKSTVITKQKAKKTERIIPTPVSKPMTRANATYVVASGRVAAEAPEGAKAPSPVPEVQMEPLPVPQEGDAAVAEAQEENGTVMEVIGQIEEQFGRVTIDEVTNVKRSLRLMKKQAASGNAEVQAVRQPKKKNGKAAKPDVKVTRKTLPAKTTGRKAQKAPKHKAGKVDKFIEEELRKEPSPGPCGPVAKGRRSGGGEAAGDRERSEVGRGGEASSIYFDAVSGGQSMAGVGHEGNGEGEGVDGEAILEEVDPRGREGDAREGTGRGERRWKSV